MRVIVRYADLSKFDGDWKDAPTWRVQTVAFFDEKKGYPEFRHGTDYYHYANENSIIGVDAATIMGHMVEKGLNPTGFTAEVTKWASENGYLIGGYIDDTLWKKAYQLGKKDRDSLRR